MQKSVFVIGGTGVMGKFLVEKLLLRGVRVDAATLDDVKSENAALRYYRQNFMDLRTLKQFLSGRNAVLPRLSQSRYDLSAAGAASFGACVEPLVRF